MTSTFLKRKSADFFRGKRAKVITKQRNLGGDEIQKDEIVTIIGKSSKDKISLDIKSDSEVTIYGVWCEYLELE
jgi:hypothetical protein